MVAWKAVLLVARKVDEKAVNSVAHWVVHLVASKAD